MMKNVATVSIDLGSAYTKVGVRRGWDVETMLLRNIPIAPRQESYCIPSVVARVESRRETQWLIGSAAASQLPGEGVRVFRNWKASLFSPSTTAESMNGRNLKRSEAIEVGIEFFKGLHQSLTRDHTKPQDLPVRVCVPKLATVDDGEAIVREILHRAGWCPRTDRATIFEPESNALGILSRGRNATWVPPQQSYRPPPIRTIAMQRMLEPSLAGAFRNMREFHGVLVTDIGAYTTDFGYVKFDSSFRSDEWGRPEIRQGSYKLGIGELDQSIFDVLSAEAKASIRSMSTSDWEMHKRALYQGTAIKARRANGGTITIGEGREAVAIKAQIGQFADRIREARAAFSTTLGANRIHGELLSGGGSMIDALRRVLLERMRAAGSHVLDLLDPTEPDQAVLAGSGRMTEGEKEKRRRQNHELVRGGSAVGGASVFFE